MSANDFYIGDDEDVCYDAGLWSEVFGAEISPGQLCGAPAAATKVILSYDGLAPFMDGYFNGPPDSDIPDGDFVVYTDKP